MTRTCIHDVRILDGLGRDIPSADVFIQEGVITDIRVPSAPAPPDWEILGGNGDTLMPGLIDGHVHLLFDSTPKAPAAMLGKSRELLVREALARARMTLRSGVTAIRDLSGTPKAMFSLKEALAGERDIPRIFDCFTVLTSRGGFGSQVALEVDAGNAAAIIREHAGKADFLKVLGDRDDPGSPEGFAPHFDDATFAAICQAAREEGRSLTVHAKGHATIRQCVANRVHSIEHAVRAEDEDLKAMACQGTFLDATLLGLKSRAENQPGFDEFDRVKAFLPRARALGVPLTLGTDGGAYYTPHFQAVRELELLVEAGLEPMDAIQSATGVAARRLGEPSLGAVSKGCKADLILLGEDPLRELGAIRRSLRWVMKGGLLSHGGNSQDKERSGYAPAKATRKPRAT